MGKSLMRSKRVLPDCMNYKVFSLFLNKTGQSLDFFQLLDGCLAKDLREVELEYTSLLVLS